MTLGSHQRASGLKFRGVRAERSAMEPTDGPRLPPRSSLVAESISEEVPTVARPVTGPVPVIEDVRARRHHTLLPRTACFAGQMMWIAIPALVLLLAQKGRVEWDDTGVPQFDRDDRALIATLVLASAGAYLFGWLWWATAAALNARQTSRHTLWPGLPIFALCVQIAAVVAARAVHLEDDIYDSAVSAVAWAAVVAAHFGVLGAFRRAATSIRAPQAPWTRVIVIPWAAVAFNAVGAFFVGFISQTMTMIVIGVQFAVLLWYILSFYQAMVSFDRGCIGRVSMGQDDNTFERFLHHRR